MVTSTLFDAGVFETAGNPRKPSASLSLSHRPRGETQAKPLYISPIPPDVSLDAFRVGMSMLHMNPQPQQDEIAALLEATNDDGLPLYPEAVIEEPRRSSKTTSIWAVLLGRCATIPGYQVVTTAQTGIKARERFMTVQRILARDNIGDYVIKKGAGAEAIEWVNGSRLWVVPPEGGAFRGDGADAILIDEAQEHNEDASADIKGGALALMDTRPSGQLIVTGTTGKSRSGMLWDYLERGRKGGIGIIEYALPDGTPIAIPVELADTLPPESTTWQRSLDGKVILNEAALLLAHPGIGTLTTLDVIRARFTGMPLPQFSREYAGLWPYDINTRAIDPAHWKACTVLAYPPKPARYAIGYDVAPDQSSAALVAAWRDADGVAWLEVIEHQPGDAWLPKAIHALTRRSPNLRVGYDNIGPNQAIADRLNREARPRPKLHSLGTREITAAAAQLSQDIKASTLRVRSDASLDAAAEIATRRPIGDGSWAWGRRAGQRDGGDIAPLVAGTNALKIFDLDTRPEGRTRIHTRKAS